MATEIEPVGVQGFGECYAKWNAGHYDICDQQRENAAAVLRELRDALLLDTTSPCGRDLCSLDCGPCGVARENIEKQVAALALVRDGEGE